MKAVEVQEVTRANEPPKGSQKLSEAERLKLHNLFLQRQLQQEQLNNLTLRFLQTEQPKSIQEKIDALGKEINAGVEQACRQVGLNTDEYQINIDDGTFVRRPDGPQG